MAAKTEILHKRLILMRGLLFTFGGFRERKSAARGELKHVAAREHRELRVAR